MMTITIIIRQKQLKLFQASILLTDPKLDFSFAKGAVSPPPLGAFGFFIHLISSIILQQHNATIISGSITKPAFTASGEYGKLAMKNDRDTLSQHMLNGKSQ